jgi:hypothetical protein
VCLCRLSTSLLTASTPGLRDGASTLTIHPAAGVREKPALQSRLPPVPSAPPKHDRARLMARLFPGIHRSVVRHRTQNALQKSRTSEDLLERLQDAERRDEEAAAALSAELSAIGLSRSPTRSPTLIPARLKSLAALSLASARAHQLSHALPRSPTRSGPPAAAVTAPRRPQKTRPNRASGSRRSRLHPPPRQQPSPASLATRHLNGVALTLAVECDDAPYFPATPRHSCVARAPRRDWAPTTAAAAPGGGGPRGVSRTRALHGQWKSSRRARSRPLHRSRESSRIDAQPPR